MNHSLTCIKTLAILLLLLFAAALPAMAEPSARRSPQTGGKGGAAGHGQYQYGRCHATGAAAWHRA